MDAGKYFDKMFDEKQFDTLETKFVGTQFLRGELEEKNRVMSNLAGKTLLSTLQKEISPWTPN